MSFEISAIVPCFNGAKFVEQALDSISNQTVAVREIIFIDDGSTDDSFEVANRWQDANPNIKMKILRQDNAGVSAARNLACETATTEWLSFLDVDDIWYPQHNAILTAALSLADPCVMIFCDCDRIVTNSCGAESEGECRLPSAFANADILDEVRSKPPLHRYSVRSYLHRRLLAGSFVPTCSTLVRKSAFESVGGFEIGRAFGEDRLFWLRMFTAGTVYAMPDIVACTRYHDFNATHSRNAIMELLAKVSLTNDLCENAETYRLGPIELSIVRDHAADVLTDLRYAASSQGIGNMRLVKRELGPQNAIRFEVRDWIRGAIGTVRNSFLR